MDIALAVAAKLETKSVCCIVHIFVAVFHRLTEMIFSGEYRDGIVRPPPPKIAKLSEDSFSSVSSPVAPSPGAPSASSPRSLDVQSPAGGPASVTSNSTGASMSRNVLDPNQTPIPHDTFNSFVSAMTHLTAERTRALIFVDSCLRTDNPQHTKWLKYQGSLLAFLSFLLHALPRALIIFYV
jgi:hypothetical protein